MLASSTTAAFITLILTTGQLTSANPLPPPRRSLNRRSTVFHNTQNASASDFNPLHHLAGIAPYFDSPGVELNPLAPEGCVVEKAAYLVRHGNIEANSYDYEAYLQPFLSKLVNFTSSSPSNASAWLNTSLPFLATYTPLLDPTNATAQISHVPESGRKDAFELGQKFSGYLGGLLPNGSSASNETFKVWSATASRDIDTATSFTQGLFANASMGSNMTELIMVGEGELAAANTLTPHESCETYSGSAGSTEQSTWRSIYAQPIADRLNTETTFNWTVTDVFAAQQLCGYDTVISGAVSAWCNATAFTNEDWLGFEYANDLMYHYSLGYGFPSSPSLGLPYLLAVSDFLLPTTTFANASIVANNFSFPPELVNHSNYTSTINQSYVPSEDQKLYVSFSHREEPAFLATALGIFNNTVGLNGTTTDFLGVPINETMPTDHINRERAWKTSEILPFLGHIGIERLSCPAMPLGNQTFIRVLVNHAPIPLPTCRSGPGASCPSLDFTTSFLPDRIASYGDFIGACGLERQSNATDTFEIFQGVVLP